MSKHIPNKKQTKAFEQVIKAIDRAKKAGLVFYGKQDNLVAYTKQANDYIKQYDFDRICATGYRAIPYISDSCLTDSGADDYPCYKKDTHQHKFYPY